MHQPRKDLVIVSSDNFKYHTAIDEPFPKLISFLVVQPFDQYFVYTYKYVVETDHFNTEESLGSSVRIK